MIRFVLRLTYLGTLVWVITLGFSWSWGRPQPWSKLYNLPALFLASEAARMWHLLIWQGIVRLTYTGHSNNSVFLGFFLPCRILPTDHLQCLARRLARLFQALSKHLGNSLCCGTRLAEIKGVSALTDRSGVVYSYVQQSFEKQHIWSA